VARPRGGRELVLVSGHDGRSYRISARGVTPSVVSMELSTNKTEEAVVATTGDRIVQPGRSGC
jgi:hypothetical protein